MLFVYTNCSPFKASDLTGSNSSSSVGAIGGAIGGTIAGRIPVVGDYKVIPSNFDVSAELLPAWGNGYMHTPRENAPDDVGAFRFQCGPSHQSYDDPLMYPGQPGAAHLHQFFGNTKADAFSTYESLRTTGDSTCGSRVNRSAYWIPAMMNGRGKVVRPDRVSIYYKRIPAGDPGCTNGTTFPGGCQNIPRGLRMIFGQKMNGTGKSPNSAWFNCDSSDWTKPAPGTSSAHFETIIEAAKNCPTGGGAYATNEFGYVIFAPSCWDGVNLDSPDHRSHLSYGGYGNDGKWSCDAAHPVGIPTFTLGAWYTVDDDLHNDIKPDGTWAGTQNGWHLSSDEMNNLEPGKTQHADWFGAWDDDVIKMWSDNCVDKLENCSGGDMGNGRQIKGASQPYPNVYFPNLSSWTTPNRIVDPPPMPAMPGM